MRAHSRLQCIARKTGSVRGCIQTSKAVWVRVQLRSVARLLAHLDHCMPGSAAKQAASFYVVALTPLVAIRLAETSVALHAVLKRSSSESVASLSFGPIGLPSQDRGKGGGGGGFQVRFGRFCDRLRPRGDRFGPFWAVAVGYRGGSRFLMRLILGASEPQPSVTGDRGGGGGGPASAAARDRASAPARATSSLGDSGPRTAL